MTASSYVIVSPVRNEAESLPQTIAAVVAQTVRPARWVIVNDGSTDRTRSIIDQAARTHAWICAVHRGDRGTRRAGSGVMEAFYDGYQLLPPAGWDFVVKLDGDLVFAPDYFERCLERFATAPRLGIASGLICLPGTDTPTAEFQDPAFHVRGPAKMYRRACWLEIGGLIRSPGWDTFDLIKANMAGWQTTTFQELAVIHLRPSGGAYGAWSNWTKNGFANYVVGYHPLFLLAKCARRAVHKPYLLAAAGLLVGFLRGYRRPAARVPDPAAISYLRRQQLNYFLGRDCLWRARHS